MKFGALIDYSLLDTDSALSYFSPLLKKHSRRQFGLLESPALLPNIYNGEISYKVFLCGKTGVGKTNTVSKLSGKAFSDTTAETLGIQVSNVYWPVQIVETKKTILFKISFWDAGELMLNTYNHILPSCLENVDCVMYLFSLASKATWNDLPRLITRIDADDDILKVCVGTRLDLTSFEVTNTMISDFEQVWKYPILKIANTRTATSHNPIDQFKKVSPFLNRLCELLWYRDQVKAGLIQQSLVDYCFVDEHKTKQKNVTQQKTSLSARTSGTTKVTFC